MFSILDTYELGPKMHYALIQAPLVARKAQAGQFVIVRISEKGERIPLTIADYDREKGLWPLYSRKLARPPLPLAP